MIPFKTVTTTTVEGDKHLVSSSFLPGTDSVFQAEMWRRVGRTDRMTDRMTEAFPHITVWFFPPPIDVPIDTTSYYSFFLSGERRPRVVITQRTPSDPSPPPPQRHWPIYSHRRRPASVAAVILLLPRNSRTQEGSVNGDLILPLWTASLFCYGHKYTLLSLFHCLINSATPLNVLSKTTYCSFNDSKGNDLTVWRIKVVEFFCWRVSLTPAVVSSSGLGQTCLNTYMPDCK